MSRLRVGTSYWLDRFSERPPRFAVLGGSHVADVAIVGGGITGCLTALLFARAGARVVLLESRRIGRGSTAASTALLMQEPDVDFGDLAARYGAATARRIWRRSAASVRGFTRLLAALRAGVQQVPSIYWTQNRETAGDLRTELTRRRAAGIAGRWLTPAALQRATGLHAGGAILTHGNAEIDPYRSCLGVANAARRAGARIFENSTVRRVTGSRAGVEIETDRGKVRADWAIIATGYATPAFKPLLRRFRMTNTYVIATPALSRGTRRMMGLGNAMLWDTERPYHYIRWTPDHRLLFGGGDRPQVSRANRASALERRARDLAAELGALYPVLAGVAPEYAWEGLFATTPDGLPYIGTHRRYPRHLFALGYSGNGMTFGFLAAQMLVRAVRGRPAADDALFGFGRVRR